MIDELIQKGIVVESQGAWIVNLEDQDLGVNLVVKSDGTLLYNAKDLGLAFKKEEDYHPLRSIYVVDARQSHALSQLFATLKRMDFNRELFHLSYDFVSLKDGAMASRKGNVIRYEEFRDALFAQAKQATQERHQDWSEKEIEKASRAVAFAAMRFGMLKQDPEKKIIFDFDEALAFEGFSGPYLLYTNARIQSLLKKAKRTKSLTTTNRLTLPQEYRLIMLLSAYPEMLFDMASSHHLSRLAQYLFELAKAFSSYYNDVPILQSSSESGRPTAAEKETKAQRLGLLKAVQQVLQNGLALMGIDVVDEM
jgi:arginyl-tRNA synthetase